MDGMAAQIEDNAETIVILERHVQEINATSVPSVRGNFFIVVLVRNLGITLIYCECNQ